MRRAACLAMLALLLPTVLAAPRADPAGDVQVTHAVGAVHADPTPYADCAQPAADLLALEGGASGNEFRLSMTLAAWGTQPACSVPLAVTADARRYTLLALAQDGASDVSFARLLWSVDDGAERASATLFFRDGRNAFCDGGAYARDGATLTLACPLVGTATVGGAPRAYDLRSVAWTYSAQANLASVLVASTVRFHDATADFADRT